MTEDTESQFTAADFRVRLFLSVDLSGSTAFKNSADGEKREHASPKWVTTFEQFYRDFPTRYKTSYQNHTTAQVGDDSCPKLWKAVGDELIFCGRVNTRKSVMTSLMAFIHTLQDYRTVLSASQTPLNLKGAGWLATFPEPNRAVQLRSINGEASYLTASEGLEAAADREPFEYDFLGKAIDTGFRVAGLAKPERFALSVQLAKLLASCGDGSGFSHPIRFDRPVQLKGVNSGEGYPYLYIDTMDNLKVKDIRDQERKLLSQHTAPSKDELTRYLDAYCEVVGTDSIELPMTKDDAACSPPRSYTEHKERISAHLQAEKDREFGEIDGLEPVDDNGGSIPEGSGLAPLE